MHHYEGLGYDRAIPYKSRLEQKNEQLKRRGTLILRTASTFVNMMLFILVGLLACFSIGPILGGTLTYLEIKIVIARPYPGTYVSEYDYRIENIAEIGVGLISIGLGITGFVGFAMVLHSREEIPYWLDGVMMCNLQILSTHNVRYPALRSIYLLTKSLACSVVAKPFISLLGYMDSTRDGVVGYTRDCYRIWVSG